MSSRAFLIFISVFAFTNFVQARVTAAKDSITFYPDSIQIQLSNKFIIESSLKITWNDSLIKPNQIDPIEGIVFLDVMLQPSLLVIEYNYLTDPLPKVIGPKWKNLPPIDSLLVYEKTDKILGEEPNIFNNQNIFSSGNLFRSLTLSPTGSSEFQGGVQMEINGIILDNINISGVLTDQNIPIQDEGVTRDLEDFDNIFLKVHHPKFVVNAGDIEYSYSDKFNNIYRKLEGLKNEFKIGKWSGSSVYANSKGRFHYIEIKGRDGDQGPYQLVGKDGNQNIAILSGTEKVWVNGKRLTRGHNYDYTIDYSLAVIYFTPTLMIDFDTDIFIEYQYSDFEYQKGIRGLTLKNNIGNSGYVSLGFFNEFDQFNKSTLLGENPDLFSSQDSSVVIVNSARLDSSGDYVLQDSFYVYAPLNIGDNSFRYNVQFFLDPMGLYQKKVSEESKIFFQYIGHVEKSPYAEYYSPYKTINSPSSQQFGNAQLSFNINEYLSIQGQLSGSGINNNIINSNKFSKALSHVVNIELDTIEFNYFNLKFSYKNQKRDPTYSPLGREQDIMQSRLWNLGDVLVKNSNEKSFQSQIAIKNFGTSNLEYAGLKHGNIDLKRYRFNQKFLNKNYSNSYLDLTYVDNFGEKYYRALAKVEKSGSRFSPSIAFSSEQSSFDHRYEKTGLAIKFNSKRSNIKTGIDFRVDQDYVNKNNWSIISNDFIAYTDINTRTEKGWKKNIVYKKRIKKGDKGHNYNYSLLDLSISWKSRMSPLSLNLDLRKEETLSQNRTIVYEFIGTGLGTHRYDSDLNTYIYDINGDHISYSINIGDRTPKTIILGSQNFVIDFSKSNIFPFLIIRSQINQEYHGKNFNISNFRKADILDTNTTKSFIFLRNDIILSKNRSTRIWLQYRENLEGYDPRGNNITIDRVAGIEQVFKWLDNSSVKNKIDIHDYYIESRVYSARNRQTKGLWNEIMFQTKFNNKLDFIFSFLSGLDDGQIYGEDFSANALGLKNSLAVYLNKKGRIQTEISFVNVRALNNDNALPPEALKGFAYGKSVRTNTRFHYLFNQTLSFNLNFNTINDIRYKNLMSLQGELRAYF